MAKTNQRAALGDDDMGETQQDLAARQAAAANGETPAPATKPNAAVKAMAEVHRAAAANPALQAGSVQPAESVYNRLSVIVKSGVTKDDLERTDYWQHNAKQFRRGDEVRVQCEDGSYIANLLVMAVGPKDVKMHVYNMVALEAIAPDAFDMPLGYSISYRGEMSQWTVIRNNEVLKEGFAGRGEAQNWMRNHLLSVQR